MRRCSDVSIGHAEHRLLESPSGTTTCTTPTLLDTAAAITVATLASAAVAAASTRSASGSIVDGVVKQVLIDGVVSHPNGDFFFCPTGGCPGNCQFDCDLCMSCTPIGSGPLDDSAWRTARACARGACARGARACRSYMNWNTSLNKQVILYW